MSGQPNTDDHYFLGVNRTALRRYELFNEIMQPATEMRLATLKVRPNARILEVGCGIGRTACYFAEKIVPDGRVVGFDQSEQLVELARHFAEERGIRNVVFYADKAQDHVFEPSAFDLAHSRFVLSYSPFARTIVQRIHDALVPGGMLFAEEIVQDYIRHEPSQDFLKLCGWFEQLITLSGGDPNYGRNALPSHMLEAGFSDLTVTSYAPVKDQAKNYEMLRLALSSEMRQSIVDNGIGTAEEVEACVKALGNPDPASLISVAPAYQVTGVRP